MALITMDRATPAGWSGNQAWPDRAIAAIAARQRTIVSHAQLRELGIRPSTIAAALARGRLHPVHQGIHSLVPASARPLLAAEHAALLAPARASRRDAAHGRARSPLPQSSPSTFPRWPTRPKRIVFVDALPKNPSGKILKRELRKTVSV